MKKLLSGEIIVIIKDKEIGMPELELGISTLRAWI